MRQSQAKIILFYLFTPLSDPAAVQLWQKSLCQQLGLRGRLIIAPHGINGTLGGPIDDVKTYVKTMRSYQPFRDIVYKWSNGGADDFPRLSVKLRDELVAFKAADELRVDSGGVVGGGKHLKPAQVHQLVAERGDEVVFFDGRNAHEAAIGKFKDAVVPDTNTTRDFIGELESGKYDELKHRPVVTYCTGGIRCEVLSSLMINRGFKEVYQIDGGIVKYGEAYGDNGLWQGSLRVFDDRMTVDFSDQAAVIGRCSHCGAATNNYENCILASCNDLVLICQACTAHPERQFHSEACRQLGQVPQN